MQRQGTGAENNSRRREDGEQEEEDEVRVKEDQEDEDEDENEDEDEDEEDPHYLVAAGGIALSVQCHLDQKAKIPKTAL